MTRDIHPLWSQPIAAVTALTTAWGLVVAAPQEVRAAEPDVANAIRAVEVDEQSDRTVIRVEAASRPTFTVFKLSDPMRLFIDIVDGDVSAIAAATDVRNGVVARITAQQQTAGDATIGRLVIGFDQDASYDIRTEGATLLVIVDGAGRTRPDLRLKAAEAEAQRIEKALERERQLLAQLKAARLEEERLQRQAVAARGQEESLTQQVQSARAEAERLSDIARIEADRMMKELEALKKKRSLEQEKADALARAIEADTARKAALVEERKAAEKLKAATERALEQEKARLAAIGAAQKRAEAEREAAVAAVKAAREREAAAQRVSEAKARGESARIRELSVELQKREEALTRANTTLTKHQKALEEAQLAQAQAEARLKKANDDKLAREAERRQAAEEALAMERTRVKALQEALAAKDSVEARRRAQITGASDRAQQQLAELERKLEAQRKSVAAAQEQTEVEQARIALLKDQLESEQASLERLRKERAGEEARVATLKQEVAGLEKARQAAIEARVQAEAMRKAEEARNAEAARQAGQALKKVADAERQAAEAVKKAEAARREAAKAEARGDAAAAAAVARANEAERKASEAEARAREAAAGEQRARQAAQREAAEAARRAAEAEQKLAAAERRAQELAEAAGKTDAAAVREAKAAKQRAEEAERRAAEATRRIAAADAQVMQAQQRADAAEAKAQAAERRAEAAEQAHADAAKARAELAELAARPVVRDISFKEAGAAGEVRVALTGATKHEIVRHGGRRLELRLKSATIPAALERSLDTTELKGPVKLVSSFRAVDDPSVVRIVVDLREDAIDDVRVDGDALVWAFTPRAEVARPAVAQAPAAPKQVPGRRTPPGVHTYPGAVAAQGGAVPGDTGAAARQIQNRRRRAAQRQYTGKKINLTIKDADIQHVLTFLAKEGGVNIVASEKVRGKVTFHLENVPWDLALDMILKTQGYDYVREAGVIRVAPAADIQAEFEAELKKKTVISGLKPMVVRFITVNYADLPKLKEHIATVLSKSGTVSVDQATSTLIVKDIEEHVQAAEDIVRRLDVQLPQVLIEARIVEASTSFSQEFGVQWGGNFIMAPAFGNPTGLAFPSIVGVSGGADDPAAPTGGILAANPNFAVNLPAAAGAGAGGAIGLTLGSLGGAANLNLRLSAAEDTGSVKIVSAPKILTLDGQKAIIQQGISVPISVVSANGVNTQFFNADLKLEVLTNSSPDGNIRLDLDITKNEPDFGQVSATGAPAIQKKEAHTSLLVRDGETTVIGGIFTRNTGRSEARVPFFSKIPILGWFFKNTRETDNRTELLIFITPRIANRRASVVQGGAGGL